MSGNKRFVGALIAVSAAAAAVAILAFALTVQPTRAVTYHDVPAGGSIQATINAATTHRP